MTSRLFGNTNLNLDTARPLYLQVIEAVQRAVARGDLAPGDQIPSQRELAQQLGINPNTVQRAYREMEYAGLVNTARGMGTFITSDRSLLLDIRQEMARDARRRFLTELHSLGFTDNEVLAMVAEGIATNRTEDPTGETRPTTETEHGKDGASHDDN